MQNSKVLKFGNKNVPCTRAHKLEQLAVKFDEIFRSRKGKNGIILQL